MASFTALPTGTVAFLRAQFGGAWGGEAAGGTTLRSGRWVTEEDQMPKPERSENKDGQNEGPYAALRRHLRPEDVATLLVAPKCATLATYRRDGTVLLSPVWHEWRDRGFSVHLGARGINARLLRRDPRASIVVYEDVPPYRGVELRGTARLTMEDEQEILRRVAVRYLGERDGNAYADGYTWSGLVLRLEPGELRIWDAPG